MSIAVTAVVRPSRYFALISFAMAGTLFAAALLLACDDLIPLHHLLALSCVVAGMAIGLFPLGRRKYLRIDISGIGQIRLADTSPDAVADSTERAISDGEVVQLLRGSTFWSSLMVLRLQTQSGHTTVLRIFPDSVDTDAFHAVSVACLWVEARLASPAAQPADFSLPAD